MIKLDITRSFHSRHLLRTPTHELLFTNANAQTSLYEPPARQHPDLFTYPQTRKIHNMSAQAVILPAIVQQDSRLLVSLTSYDSSITENKNDIISAANQLIMTIQRDLSVDLKVLGYTSYKNKFAFVMSSPVVRHMKACMPCNACRRSSYPFGRLNHRKQSRYPHDQFTSEAITPAVSDAGMTFEATSYKIAHAPYQQSVNNIDMGVKS